MSLPLPPRELNDLEIGIIPELYLIIAEHLGKELTRQPLGELAINDAGQVLDWDDADEDADDDAVSVTRVGQVTQHIKYLYPTLSMLKASMVNRYYRERILFIALGWDAQSENPRALYHAAVNNHVKLLGQALAQKKAKPDHVPHGLALPVLTPLMVAAAKGYLEVVELLLDKGADAGREFDVSGSGSWRPAGLFSESYDSMLEDPEDAAAVDHVTPVHCAMSAVSNAAAITERILARVPAAFFERVADPDAKLLAFAVAADLVGVIDLLVHHNADFDHGGTTIHSLSIPVLHHAVSGGMVGKLLQRGASLHTPLAVGLNALHAVCLRRTDCHTAIEELVHRGVAVNDATAGGAQRGTLAHAHPHLFCQDRENGEFYMVTPFHDLFLPGDLSDNPVKGKETDLRESLHGAVQELLAHPLGSQALSLRQNVRFDTQDEGSKLFQKYWVDRSVLDVEEYGEFTPFQLFFMQPFVDDERIPAAMLHANDQAIREQINEVTEPYGATPLLSLLSHRFDNRISEGSFYRPKLVEWLLENGADPNIADREGFTPIHYAVFWLDDKAVDFLLAFGARIENRPASVPTPLEVALGRVYRDVHMKHDMEDSIWKQMVRLVERNGEQFTRDVLGIHSCIERWRPGGLLPVCALPGFENSFKRILLWDYEGYDARQNTGLHRELCERGVDVMLREQALGRKRHIFETIVQASGTLPLAASKCIGHIGPVKKFRYSVLDWAAATGQDEYFLVRLLQIGGAALSGGLPPYFMYWTLPYRETDRSWKHFKEVLCPGSGT
ncbi:ankyrin repeat-containing domain protein [Colletotrichum cereale]|nr:ankyrin repeat-containing domain protein [Colletotrichum cereale]